MGARGGGKTLMLGTVGNFQMDSGCRCMHMFLGDANEHYGGTSCLEHHSVHIQSKCMMEQISANSIYHEPPREPSEL